MSHLFRANLPSVRIVIAGCPSQGIPALDWRREHGLPERLDNWNDVSLEGEIPEADFRRLVAAGWKTSAYTDGSESISYCGLSQRYSPVHTWGHRATIHVSPEDSVVDLLCRALRSCAWEERGGSQRETAARAAVEVARAALAAAEAELAAATLTE